MIKKQELAKIVAKRRRMTAKVVEGFLDTFVEVLTDGLQNERQVKIKGLGTFKVTTTKERTSVSVSSGKPVLIDGYDKISFLPDSSMRDIVNKPFSQFETVVVNEGVEFEETKASVVADEQAVPEAQEYGMKVRTVDVKVGEKEQTENGQALAGQGRQMESPADAGESASEMIEYASQAEENGTPLHVIGVPDDVHEEGSDIELDEKQGNGSTGWVKQLLCGLLIALAAFALGYVVGKRDKTPATTQKADNVAVVENVGDTLKGKPTTEGREVAKEQQTEKPVTSDDASSVSAEELERANKKVAYGAYRIIGIERVVTARAGQSLKAISVANLGPGSEVYVEALNEGVSAPVEGQKIKIPKLELKKKSAK